MLKGKCKDMHGYSFVTTSSSFLLPLICTILVILQVAAISTRRSPGSTTGDWEGRANHIEQTL